MGRDHLGVVEAGYNARDLSGLGAASPDRWWSSFRTQHRRAQAPSISPLRIFGSMRGCVGKFLRFAVRGDLIIMVGPLQRPLEFAGSGRLAEVVKCEHTVIGAVSALAIVTAQLYLPSPSFQLIRKIQLHISSRGIWLPLRHRLSGDQLRQGG